MTCKVLEVYFIVIYVYFCLNGSLHNFGVFELSESLNVHQLNDFRISCGLLVVCLLIFTQRHSLGLILPPNPTSYNFNSSASTYNNHILRRSSDHSIEAACWLLHALVYDIFRRRQGCGKAAACCFDRADRRTPYRT